MCTDAEEILGIGDWGVGGIQISVGKLAVYTAAAGVDPRRVIPVSLDVGTDNERLLNDPLYLGNRHAGVRGTSYDAFIEKYLQVVSGLFPGALLHFEDFGANNARRILVAYRDTYRIFNDDMQGTGAVVMAGLFNALKVTGTRWRDQRVVILGGGTAGVGIADQIRAQMVRDGLDAAQAARQIWIVDVPGLLTEDMGEGLLDYQRPYARPAAEAASWAKTPVQVDPSTVTRWPQMAALRKARAASGIITLETVVGHVKPTVLIGASTAHGAFTQQVVETMSVGVDPPVIFPISNPTSQIEAMPADIIAWSKGKALVATGLPIPPVDYAGVRYWIGQANNALLYPGLGLGTIVSGASEVTDGMLLAAAETVAGQADVRRRAPPCCGRWRICAPPRRPPRSPSPGPRPTTTWPPRMPMTWCRPSRTRYGSRPTPIRRRDAGAGQRVRRKSRQARAAPLPAVRAAAADGRPCRRRGQHLAGRSLPDQLLACHQGSDPGVFGQRGRRCAGRDAGGHRDRVPLPGQL